MTEALQHLPQRPLSRAEVADIAIRLFGQQSYDATSTVDIAEAAGISRSTFFHQFWSKEDVILADHEELVQHIDTYFASKHLHPWLAVCEAATMVAAVFPAATDPAELAHAIEKRLRAQTRFSWD